MISLDDTVEVFHPSTGKSCVSTWFVPEGWRRYRHTHCNDLLCGGRDALDSCLRVGENYMETTLIVMHRNRKGHMCWAVPGDSGDVMLFGGEWLDNGETFGLTTETVLAKGGPALPGYDLEYNTL